MLNMSVCNTCFLITNYNKVSFQGYKELVGK